MMGCSARPGFPIVPATTDDAALGDLLVRASRTLRRRWALVLEPWGLSPHQTRALRVVGPDTSMRLSDLARAQRIAPRSATEVVDALAERGLAERTTDPGDRRAVLVRLTDDGRSTHRAVDRARAADVETYLERLDPGEQAMLARLLQRLVDDPAG